jgi:hypothetical protein
LETDIEWHAWKKILGTAVHAGESLGMAEKSIADLAYRIGGILADHFDPGNREQRLIKELWEQGDESEKRALTTLLVRMVDNDVSHPGLADRTEKPDTH